MLIKELILIQNKTIKKITRLIYNFRFEYQFHLRFPNHNVYYPCHIYNDRVIY